MRVPCWVTPVQIPPPVQRRAASYVEDELVYETYDPNEAAAPPSLGKKDPFQRTVRKSFACKVSAAACVVLQRMSAPVHSPAQRRLKFKMMTAVFSRFGLWQIAVQCCLHRAL